MDLSLFGCSTCKFVSNSLPTRLSAASTDSGSALYEEVLSASVADILCGFKKFLPIITAKAITHILCKW